MQYLVAETTYTLSVMAARWDSSHFSSTENISFCLKSYTNREVGWDVSLRFSQDEDPSMVRCVESRCRDIFKKQLRGANKYPVRVVSDRDLDVAPGFVIISLNGNIPKN